MHIAQVQTFNVNEYFNCRPYTITNCMRFNFGLENNWTQGKAVVIDNLLNYAIRCNLISRKVLFGTEFIIFEFPLEFQNTPGYPTFPAGRKTMHACLPALCNKCNWRHSSSHLWLLTGLWVTSQTSDTDQKITRTLAMSAILSCKVCHALVPCLLSRDTSFTIPSDVRPLSYSIPRNVTCQAWCRCKPSSQSNVWCLVSPQT